MNDEALLQLGQRLKEQKLTISFAESATGGSLTARMSQLPKAGDFLLGGICCYNACLKESLLKVPTRLIEEYTPESLEVTKAITEAWAKICNADITVGITGLPSPGGSETELKPVGTMFVHGIVKQKEAFSETLLFSGNSRQIIERTLASCIEYIHQALDKLEKKD